VQEMFEQINFAELDESIMQYTVCYVQTELLLQKTVFSAQNIG